MISKSSDLVLFLLFIGTILGFLGPYCPNFDLLLSHEKYKFKNSCFTWIQNSIFLSKYRLFRNTSGCLKFNSGSFQMDPTGNQVILGYADGVIRLFALESENEATTGSGSVYRLTKSLSARFVYIFADFVLQKNGLLICNNILTKSKILWIFYFSDFDWSMRWNLIQIK